MTHITTWMNLRHCVEWTEADIRVRTVWFHLHEVQEQKKWGYGSIRTHHVVGWRTNTKTTRGIVCGGGDILYLWSVDGYKVKWFVNVLLNCALKISVVCHMFMITERGTFTHVRMCTHIALGDESGSKNSAPFKLPLCAKAPEIHSHTCTDLQSLPLLCS